MTKEPFPMAKVYQLLEPGPVVLVSTARNEQANIMTMSWHTMMEFEPPILGCVIGNQNYSFDIISETKECVINIPSVKLIKEVVGIGNCSGAKVDKFKKFHLTKIKAFYVQPPLIEECFANLECKVIDMSMASKYNLFILEVLSAWNTPSKIKPKTVHHCGNGLFVVDGKTILLKSNKK